MILLLGNMKLMKISKKIALIIFFGSVITLRPWFVFADEEVIVPQDESPIIIDTPSSTDSNLSETPTSTQESETVTNETAEPTVHFIVRYEDQFIFNDTIPLPTSTAITYHENGSENQQTTQTNQSSVLATLVTTDNLSDNFSISDLAYYSSFNSYLLNCIAISNPIVATPCYNWNYIVNNTYPLVGMDQNILRGGETVYVYFSNPWRITATTSTFPLGTTTTFQTERFQYDNLSSPWVADPDDQISISIPNPNPTGWWDTTITVSTTMSDSNGLANFLFDTTGTYSVQITSPDFSKYSNPININVTELTITEETAEASTETQDASGSQQSGGSGGGVTITHNNLNIEEAIQFLSSHQNTDGSLGNLLTTDWAAIAFAANNSIPANLRAYLISNPNPGNSLTDIERRAMAIMSLGINPYNGTATNYIEAILNQFHDNQFGDTALINDDIFALFPLIKAGVQTDDPRIQSTVQSIISFQNQNGSWGSVDLTSAAIQALSLAPNATGVSASISKARQYLAEEQQINGSFDHNPFATAWAMQAIKALGESSINWQKGGRTPGDYLASIQNNDGAMNTNPNDATTRLWGTSYAIVGALEKPWQQILQDFSRPQTNTQNSQSGSAANLMNNEPVQTTTTVQIYEQTTSTVATSTQNNTETLEIISLLSRTEETTPTTENIIPPQTKQLSVKNKFEQKIIAQTLKENPQIPPETNLMEATFQPPNPIQENAKKIFAAGTALTSTLGLYLGWRLLLALL